MNHTVKMKAGHLAKVQECFANIKGDRPLMLSYKIAQFLKPVGEMQDKLMERLREHADDQGAILEGHLEEVTAILEEEVEFEAPHLAMDELAACDKLTVSDDSVLLFLLHVGALQ